MRVAVGQDIESICNKCGDVWHVVVAMVESKIAKVQCKECGSYHRHRPPGGTATKRSRSPSPRTKKAPTPRIDTPTVPPDLSRPVRPYRFSDEYAPGDRIEHPNFGTGVVEETNAPGKMQVFFADGRRILARAKTGPTLARPKPFEHQSAE